MERVNDQQTRLDEQFQRQTATPQTINQVERLLRDSRESFEQVRTTSPTRFRFRVVNQEGQDIRDTAFGYNSQIQQNDQRVPGKSAADAYSTCSESTLVESIYSGSMCIEPAGSESTGSESTRVEPACSEHTGSGPAHPGSIHPESTYVEPPFVDQWWEGIKDSIRTDWPGVEEKAGHYCIVEHSV